MFRRDPETRKYVYLADRERKLIAVYNDPAAIFNSPLDTRGDDVFYVVNKKVIPKKNTPVRLVMEPAPEDALDPKNLKDGAHLVRPGGGPNPPKQGPKEDGKK